MNSVDPLDFREQIEAIKGDNKQLRSEGLSQNRRLNRLIPGVGDDMPSHAEGRIPHLKKLVKIGLALSVEKDRNKVLEMIVTEARSISNADAGTLYVVDGQRKTLRFEIMQNDTLDARFARTGDIEMPPILLEADGKPNYGNVASYAALTGNIVNIPDVYKAEGFDFTGPRMYDAATGYRSKSMLVIPMKNHDNDIIGVLQLINAQAPDSLEIICFSEAHVDLIASLASQAGVTLTNTALVRDLKNLFHAFIKSIATAIDEKSPYTGGHVRRVADLTLLIANRINEAEEGPFADICFSEDELEELRLAAWMHDVGKIATPEHIINKKTKLETIFDRIHLVETRFGLIREAVKNKYLHEKIRVLESNGCDAQTVLSRLEERLRKDLELLEEEKNFVVECNKPGTDMHLQNVEKLREIAQKSFEIEGRQFPYLTSDELHNLSIPKGSLTVKERSVIEQHAVVTTKILEELPFPKKLSRVPEYASYHHERIDGSGYPFGLSADKLPLQARIIALADVFEALTARDRPYKRPMALSGAIDIMAKDNAIDPDIFELFIESGLYREYARRELSPEQIDSM
ncbi:MAG: GAF and HD-GYP domain-containing protein [Syntrophobacteraceae bacterium]